MKAVIQDRYGSPSEVLRVGDVPIPVPGPDEVLVRVKAASVHADIWHSVIGIPYILRFMGSGIFRPKNKIPGTDMSGVVERVGENVENYRAGDEVFGETLRTMQWINGGAFAEYVCVWKDALAKKPKSVSFEEAAAVATSGLIALTNLPGLGHDLAGKKVLVNGAGGAVGGMALQLAKAFGADVTAVDHGRKKEVLLSLGADRAIDYTSETVFGIGERYDLIFDVASNLIFDECKKALTPAGIFVIIGHDHYGQSSGKIFGSIPKIFRLVARSSFDPHLPKANFKLPEKGVTMPILGGLLASGKLKPVIDRVYALEEVREAIERLQSEAAMGRIILRI